MPALLLYDSRVSGNCYKVWLLLTHLGVEYERREVDVVDRSNRFELLGGLNPALRVPTLVLDDGRPLAESTDPCGAQLIGRGPCYVKAEPSSSSLPPPRGKGFPPSDCASATTCSTTGVPRAPPKPWNALQIYTFGNGRYWARTSDLRLVEAALSQLS